MASPQPGPSHVQAQATPDGSPRSQDHVRCPYLQGQEPGQQLQYSCYRPIEPDCHPFFNQIKRHFLKQPHVYQEFIDIMQDFFCSLTVMMDDLSALGEDQPSWREWLSTHLMPLHVVALLTDGQIVIQQRVLSKSSPTTTRTSATDEDNIATKWVHHQHGKKRRPRQRRRQKKHQQNQRRKRQLKCQDALLKVVIKQASCRPQSRVQLVEAFKSYNFLIVSTTRHVANLLHPVRLHNFNSFLPSGCWLEENIYKRRKVLLHLPLGGTVPYSWDDELQMLGSLAVDTVYPAAGLIRMGNERMRHNKDKLCKLRKGVSFRMMRSRQLLAGSRAEGLCVEKQWGHGCADVDFMWLCGDELGVYVLPPGQQPTEDATLVYTPQECPPAYTRLQVLHTDRLLSNIIKRNIFRSDLSASAPEVQQCVFSEGGRLWLHSRHTLEVMQPSDIIEAISGPAGQRDGGLHEDVYSLVCSGPHPAMASFRERTRKHWPSQTQLDALMQQPMLLVMVGPREAQDSNLMFRISWSTLEIILISSLHLWLKQGYVCFKYTVKSVLNSLRPKDSAREGRSQVGSYHLKTVFLRHLEEHPPQQEGSPFQLMLALCQDLHHYLLMGCLPHYFLPECDLLQTIGDDERQHALQAMGKVIAGPLVAILLSPSEPRNIYGPHHSPDDLVRRFSDVSSLPSCPQKRGHLWRLLRHLDQHREGLHRDQLKRDGYDVLERPGLVKLADYLQ